MKSNKQDELLPVVMIRERRAITSSREVARIFGKRHDNVLQDIQNLDVSKAFSLLNFQERDYTDKRGKFQKMFDMNRDGFVFLAMGYRGQKAAAFKEAYINEFNRREKEIIRLQAIVSSNRLNTEWQEARTAGKLIRRDETDAVKQFVEYAAGQGSTNAIRYYTNITKMTNAELFDITQKVENIREACDASQLGTLVTVDKIIARALTGDMADGIPYKKIYLNVKEKVQQFAGLFGKTTIPGGGTLQIGI